MPQNTASANRMLALIFISNLIGAGFASGQELLIFFVAYGYKGFFGVLTAGLLFTVFGAGIVVLAQKNCWRNHLDLANALCPYPLNKIFDLLISAFLLALTGVMLAASGALAKQELGVTEGYGIAFLGLVLWLSLLGGGKGLLKLPKYLIPPLIFVIIWVSLYSICNFTYVPSQPSPYGHWLLAAAIYASYNLLGGLSTMIAVSNLGGNGKGGLWGGIITTFLAFFMVWALMAASPALQNCSLPMLCLAAQGGKLLFGFYTAILAIAIFTTALTAVYSLNCRLNRLKMPSALKNALILTAALPVSIGNFPNIVSRTYGFFGIIGLIILTLLSFKLLFIYVKQRN
ncbi:MAG: hypothetical protein PHN47_01150 [Clostridia bacterium]|nr:hypothetical protein [Clostridia bacterium]